MNQQPSESGGFRIRSHANRSTSDCTMVDQSIDEYALGTLEAGQRAAIDRHVVRCASCAVLVSSYQQTVAVLALAAPLASPPASARTALMARIAATPQTVAPSSSVFTGNLDAFRTPTLPASSEIVAPQKPIPAEASTSWWRAYAAPLATLPLLLALGLVAAWGVNNYSQLHDSNTALAEKDMQIALLSSQLSDDNDQGVANVVTAPTTKRYVFSPESTGNNAGQGILYAGPASDQAVVQVSGLPAGTYSVVVQGDDGKMVPKTEFVVGPDGSATSLLNLGTGVTDLKSVHIRQTTTMTASDMAVDPDMDVLMTTIGPDISDDSDTSVQKP